MSKANPDPLYTLRGSGSPVSSLKFQDGSHLYSGNYDGVVHIWSMETKRVIDKVLAHQGTSVLSIDFDSCSQMFTHGRDGHVKSWTRAETGWIENNSVVCSDTGFCGSCLLAGGIIAVPGNNQSEVLLHDVSTWKVIGCLKPDKTLGKLGMCMKIRCGDTKESQQLFIGYEDGSVASWDCRNNKMVDRIQIHNDALMCMDFSVSLNKGYSGSVDENLHCWSQSQGKLDHECSAKTVNPGFNDAAVRKDGKIVVFAGWDGNIRIFSAKKLKQLAVLSFHKESVHCLAFSEDNSLACGSKDQQISLWNIYN